MKEPKKFKSNKSTTLYGLKSGLSQVATTSGLSFEDFKKIEGNTFEKQGNVEMYFMHNLFIIESNIYHANGTVSRHSKGHLIHKDAQAEFNTIKKQYKMKIVDQTTLDEDLAA